MSSAGQAVVALAFCETFDAAHGVAGTRTGDLDPNVWGVSRTGTWSEDAGHFNVWELATLGGCGAAQVVTPPNDVRTCGGRLLEAVSDAGGQTTLAMYPKQPFDIAGRTGTVTFDVSADSLGPHAAWPEFWWTDQPVPAPHGEMSAQFPYPRNGVGFRLAADCPAGMTGIDDVLVYRNYAQALDQQVKTCPIHAGSAAAALNHFEVRISETRIQVFGTDPGATALKLLADVSVAMPMTRGVLWMEDVHYNADKFGGGQSNHTFAWDNFGFDGPKTYRDRTFDVPDALDPDGSTLIGLGYNVQPGGDLVVHPAPASWPQTPTAAYVTFDWFAFDTVVPSVSINGSPFQATVWPFDAATFGWRTIAVPIPLASVHTGANTITLRNTKEAIVSNINLLLVAAAPVP